MKRALFTIDDNEWVFNDIDEEDILNFIDCLADKHDTEPQLTETISDICTELGLPFQEVMTKLEDSFRNGGKPSYYLNHII